MTRLEKLQHLMSQADLNMVALIPGPNLRYVAGAHHLLMERPLVVLVPHTGTPAVIIPQIEVEVFQAGGLAATLYPWTDADGYHAAFAQALATFAPHRLGVEGLRMRFFEAEILKNLLPDTEIVRADDALADLRIHKESDEVAALRQAIMLSESALQNTLDHIQVGMTETAILNRLRGYLTEAGGEGLAFPPLVLAGDNSARPHGHARPDYAIQPGDALLFDFGLVYEGYHADITRTFFVGEPSPDARAFYEAVLAANIAAREAARPGLTAHELDILTRDVLEKAGYAQWIIHRTGHGLGLDVHEYPNIVQGNVRVLEPGMVFTIEPGLYQPGALGVRIEDDVLITPDGVEALTTFPRELQTVG
ncbi:MAG: M24 family metallopeptidase [Anaerolineales bacterium]